MPNCFQLIRKGETEPTPLVEVDKLMCEHFAFTPHPKNYMMFWFQRIGLPLSCGKTLDEIREQIRKDSTVDYGTLTLAERIEARNEFAIYIAICDWLEANYTVNAFYSKN